MDKEQILQKLSEELSANSIYEDYISQIDVLKGSSIRVGIIGQPCTGKSTLINALLGTKLPTSTLPTSTSYRIRYAENDSILETSGIKTLEMKNEWLNRHNAEVLEINAEVVPDQTNQIDLCKIISQFDVCVFLTNAQAALNRADLFVLESLNGVGIPTLVVLSRMDLFSEEDRLSINSYIETNLKGFAKVSVLSPKKSLSDSASEITQAISNLIAQANVNNSRSNFKNFYLGYAISRLFEICQEKLDICQKKSDAIEKAANDKIAEMNSKTTDWLKIETQLRLKTSEIIEKLRSALNARKDDIIRRLNHDVEVCGDVKLFWEKDFPFRLEELMRMELNSSTQMVNSELVRTLQWLQDSLMKQFRCKMSLTTAIVADKSRIASENGSSVSVADTKKLRIVSRIGTAATVIGAGTLLATAGIGGVVMAISMISGIGAELIIGGQSTKSKERIKEAIPEIVDRAQIQIISDFNQKIDDATNEIISQLQTIKLDWIEQREKSIEQEKSIAMFNNNSAKWESLMQRINQLAELILN